MTWTADAHRHLSRVAAATGVVCFLAACHAAQPDRPTSSAPMSTPATSQRPQLLPPQPVVGVDPTTTPAEPVGVPSRLRIPSIGVDAALTTLAREPDGTMQAPLDWNQPGWYAGGPRPGQTGPAIIAGHVDSTAGPAVFYRLHQLRIGDPVLITTDGGSVLRFVVDDSHTFLKARFPTRLVYGPQPLPVLRLITCIGDFDASARSYLSNLVISAHLR
jgi:sortase (surface protein transpeptidase)